MKPNQLRTLIRTAAVCAGFVLLVTGCDKKADNTLNYSSAIDTYYSAHPACLWSEPKKFPVQANTSDDSKTPDYDALVDQGLLVRTTGEKKIIIISKQVNDYDLSDKGRAAWTADPNQPGFGNFCYGHRKVAKIDSATPTGSTAGATTQVSYHYSFSDAPAWATAAETQTAYPRIRANLSGPQTATATLTNTVNGWAVSNMPGRGTTGADGAIVE